MEVERIGDNFTGSPPDATGSTFKNIPKDSSFYDYFYDFIALFGGYLIIFFIALGVFGNIVSIVIFIRQRKRDSASALYLGCLAVSDLGNLVTGVEFWKQTSLYYMSFGRIITVRGYDDIGCKITTYVWFNCQFISAWIIIAFSVERVIAVLVPLKAASILTNWRRKCFLWCLLVFSLIVWSYTTIDFVITGPYPPFGHPDRAVCFYEMSEKPRWFFITFAVHVFSMLQVMPSIIIAVLNIIIIAGIKSKDNKVAGAKDPTRAKKEMRCVVNLLSVSTAYIVLMFPFVTLWCYQIYEVLFREWAGRSPAYIDFILELSEYAIGITSINYSINFIIYTVSLDFYREDLKNIFKCCGGKS
jgi:hypothetical protein